jgi:hypothetical protein
MAWRRVSFVYFIPRVEVWLVRLGVDEETEVGDDVGANAGA